jgi:hypothetical protein
MNSKELKNSITNIQNETKLAFEKIFIDFKKDSVSLTDFVTVGLKLSDEELDLNVCIVAVHSDLTVDLLGLFGETRTKSNKITDFSIENQLTILEILEDGEFEDYHII